MLREHDQGLLVTEPTFFRPHRDCPVPKRRDIFIGQPECGWLISRHHITMQSLSRHVYPCIAHLQHVHPVPLPDVAAELYSGVLIYISTTTRLVEPPLWWGNAEAASPPPRSPLAAQADRYHRTGLRIDELENEQMREPLITTRGGALATLVYVVGFIVLVCSGNEASLTTSKTILFEKGASLRFMRE